MSKNLLRIILIVVFASLAAYNVYRSQKTGIAPHAVLAGMEVLSDGEWKTGLNCRMDTLVHKVCSDNIWYLTNPYSIHKWNVLRK